MKGLFSSLLCLLLFGATYTKGTRLYNRDPNIIDEPRGFFSKLDSESLGDKSIWNVKDTYLTKRNLIPITYDKRSVYDDLALDSKSSIFNKNVVNDNTDLSKRNKIPEDSSDGGTTVVAIERSDQGRVQDVDDNKNDDPDDTESTDGSADASVKREIVTENSEDAEDGADYGSGSSEDEASVDSTVDVSGSGEKEANTDESGSSVETPSVFQTTSSVIPDVQDTAKVSVRKENNPIIISDVTKRNFIPKKHHKRQYISRPKFVVRNGYVYMKAPPLTQKTIVTTHIPRPPMVIPYNRFMRNYRRGGDRGYGIGRRSRYMIPERFNMETAEDNYDDDRTEESKFYLIYLI